VKAIIGKTIRKIRENKDLSQANLAEELGMNTSSYSKIERGETDASTSKLLKIAEILEVDVAVFFKDIHPKTDKFIEPNSPKYGFATKGDIDELLKMIHQLQLEIDKLKPKEVLIAKKKGKN